MSANNNNSSLSYQPCDKPQRSRDARRCRQYRGGDPTLPPRLLSLTLVGAACAFIGTVRNNRLRLIDKTRASANLHPRLVARKGVVSLSRFRHSSHPNTQSKALFDLSTSLGSGYLLTE